MALPELVVVVALLVLLLPRQRPWVASASSGNYSVWLESTGLWSPSSSRAGLVAEAAEPVVVTQGPRAEAAEAAGPEAA